jgi:hypothetical protein
VPSSGLSTRLERRDFIFMGNRCGGTSQLKNKFTLKRGLRDEDDGSTRELERYKAGSGLAHRTDIMTFFDYYEVDEGRKP